MKGALDELSVLLPAAQTALVIGRVHQEGERHHEGFLHFLWRQHQRLGLHRGIQQSHYRVDPIARAGGHAGQAAQHLDLMTRQADLLGRLAQGPLGGRGIFRIQPAARKGNLPPVVAQPIAAHRQQNAQPLGRGQKRYQHGSRGQRAHRRGVRA